MSSADEGVPGLLKALDGLVFTASHGFPRREAEQLATTASRLRSPAHGTGTGFDTERTEQVIVCQGVGYPIDTIVVKVAALPVFAAGEVCS